MKQPLIELTRHVLDQSLLWTHKELRFSAALEEGHPCVLAIAGESPAGKSLLAQCLVSWAHQQMISPISVSIKRTGAGTSELAGMRRMMMFGDQSEQSTGATSARVIGTAFRTLENRAQENVSGLLVLDEPELGSPTDTQAPWTRIWPRSARPCRISPVVWRSSPTTARSCERSASDSTSSQNL